MEEDEEEEEENNDNNDRFFFYVKIVSKNNSSYCIRKEHIMSCLLESLTVLIKKKRTIYDFKVAHFNINMKKLGKYMFI